MLATAIARRLRRLVARTAPPKPDAPPVVDPLPYRDVEHQQSQIRLATKPPTPSDRQR